MDQVVRILKESLMDATKLTIVETGITVVRHVGLTPQAISVLGGFGPQEKMLTVLWRFI